MNTQTAPAPAIIASAASAAGIALKLPRTDAAHLAAHCHAGAWFANQRTRAALTRAGIAGSEDLDTVANSAAGITVDAGDLQLAIKNGVAVIVHASGYQNARAVVAWNVPTMRVIITLPDVGPVKCEWKNTGIAAGERTPKNTFAEIIVGIATDAAIGASRGARTVPGTAGTLALHDALIDRHNAEPGHIAIAPAQHPAGFTALARRALVNSSLPARVVALPGIAGTLAEWITAADAAPAMPARAALEKHDRIVTQLTERVSCIADRSADAGREWARKTALIITGTAMSRAEERGTVKIANDPVGDTTPRSNYGARREGSIVKTTSGMEYTVPAHLAGNGAALYSALSSGTAPKTQWGIPSLVAGTVAGAPAWLLKVGCHFLPAVAALPELADFLPMISAEKNENPADDLTAALINSPHECIVYDRYRAVIPAGAGSAINAAAMRHDMTATSLHVRAILETVANSAENVAVREARVAESAMCDTIRLATTEATNAFPCHAYGIAGEHTDTLMRYEEEALKSAAAADESGAVTGPGLSLQQRAGYRGLHDGARWTAIAKALHVLITARQTYAEANNAVRAALDAAAPANNAARKTIADAIAAELETVARSAAAAEIAACRRTVARAAEDRAALVSEAEAEKARDNARAALWDAYAAAATAGLAL